MLTIGYGDGGVAPWQFMFRQGDNKDLGFFKLFLCTHPAHFSSILQESPFETSNFRAGKPVVAVAPLTERWATKLVTIIQVDA